MVGLLLYRGRVISWLRVLWLGGLILLSLMAVRRVSWWALGAAPVVAFLLSGLELRGRRVGDLAYHDPRWQLVHAADDGEVYRNVQ